MPSFDSREDHALPGDADSSADSDDEPPVGHTSLRRRPSVSPPELAQQLLRELARLRNTDLNDEERSDAFHLARVYLAHAQALAWKDVVLGTDLLGPRRVLLSLQLVRPFVDRHYPDLEPAGQIAVEIETVLAGLLAAEDALERVRTERRMRDHDLSALEHAILRVLLRANGSQRRGQVYEGLDPRVRRSLPWVGKVLQKLSDDGYLHTSRERAQGNPETTFYKLSNKGREFCRTAGLLQDIEAEASLRRLISQTAVTLRKTATNPVERGLAEGVLDAKAGQHGLGEPRPDGSFDYKLEEVLELADV